MRKAFKRFLAGALGAVLVAGMALIPFGKEALASDDSGSKVVKIAFTDAPTLQIGDTVYNHPSYAAMLAFKGSFEKSTGGEYTVELYPGGTLGDAASNLEELVAGTLQGATPADGALSAFAPDIQIFSIPYMFDSPLQAYDILDGEFGQRLFEGIAESSGLRVIASYDNGGYRNFTNSVKEIKTAADMNGMKFRVMDSPVYMKLVESMGATGTPIGFLELYSALQTGVVEGQENSAITTLGASLDEVQKYCTQDGHLLGLAFLTISNDWYNSLDAETQEKVLQAGREASFAARGICRQAEAQAIETLKANGVQVYVPTAEELQTFKDASQQAVADWVRENVNKELADELLALVASGTVGTGKGPAAAATAAAPASAGSATQAAQTTGGGSNTLTIVFGAVAVIAVLFAVFTASKNKKPEADKSGDAS